MTPSVSQGSSTPSTRAPTNFKVDLPAGGQLDVNNAQEKDWWDELASKYIDDYGLVRANDLMLLGAILSQSLHMYRHQLNLNDPKLAGKAITEISKASEQIQALEKALGIDKKTREAGGQHTVVDFLTRVKAAAHKMGLRISDRVLEHEAFANELRWRIRVLRNGDAEDRKHHGITPDSILEFCERTLADIDEHEKVWAAEEGAIFVGTL